MTKGLVRLAPSIGRRDLSFTAELAESASDPSLRRDGASLLQCVARKLKESLHVRGHQVPLQFPTVAFFFMLTGIKE